MKKVLLLAIAGMFIFASCKKEYTCECEMTYTSISFTSKTVSLRSNAKLSKKEAKSWCDLNNYSYAGTKSMCTLK
jgi:hypothetical protein